MYEDFGKLFLTVRVAGMALDKINIEYHLRNFQRITMLERLDHLTLNIQKSNWELRQFRACAGLTGKDHYHS